MTPSQGDAKRDCRQLFDRIRSENRKRDLRLVLAALEELAGEMRFHALGEPAYEPPTQACLLRWLDNIQDALSLLRPASP